MDVNKLYERLEKNKEKLAKTHKTLENHKKQLDKKALVVVKLGFDPTKCNKMQFSGDVKTDAYWAMCDYEDKIKAIKNTEKKINEIKTMILDIEGKIAFEQNQINTLNDTVPQILKDFVESWKKLAYEWHVNNFKNLQQFKQDFKNREYDARLKCILNHPTNFRYLKEQYNMGTITKHDVMSASPYAIIDNYLKPLNLDYKSYEKEKSKFGGIALRLNDMSYDAERNLYLDRVLEKEKISLLLDLMARISKVVGVVTDASNLYLSNSGQINGYIIGTKGKAQVETVGAGGYNIQCFHFRTLVKPLN